MEGSHLMKRNNQSQDTFSIDEWTFPPLDKILKKIEIGKNFTTA